MGSGGGLGKVLEVASLGLISARNQNKALSEAIDAQTQAMQQAQQEQQKAYKEANELQEKAMDEQQTAQDQARERAEKENANLTRENADRKNKADLTSGLAEDPKTQGVMLGSGDVLGAEDNEDDWF